MANYTLDPDATPSAPDDLTEWGTYADIDDAVRDPTDASTGGDGSALAKTNGLFTRTTRVELTTDTITGTVSQAVVRIYANTQTNCTITANLKAGGSWIGQQTIVAAGQSSGWYSVTFSSLSLSQSDVDGLILELAAVGTAPSVSSANCYAAYVVISEASGSVTMEADAGTYALTGQPAGVGMGFSLDFGSFNGTGQTPDNVGVDVPVAQGSYGVIGFAQGYSIYTMAVDAGTYTYTGKTMRHDLTMAAGFGVYTLYGQEQVPTVFEMVAAAGTYTVAGQGITTGLSIPLGFGEYELAGQDPLMGPGFIVVYPHGCGLYALTGEPITVAVDVPVANGSYTLTGQSSVGGEGRIHAHGSYVLSGQGIAPGVSLPVAHGVYAYTGQASHPQGAGMQLGTGMYAVTGEPVSTGAGAAFTTGHYVLTGKAVAVAVGLSVATGEYDVTGQSIEVDLETDLGHGVYVLSGQRVILNPVGHMRFRRTLEPEVGTRPQQ